MGEITVLPQRRSVRLQGYDYASAGAYFITVCTHERRCLFGDIVDDKMGASAIGQVAEQCWQATPAHFPDVQLDELTLMPNHLHGILVLPATVPATGDACVAPTKPVSGPARRSIAAIVGSFKSAVTRKINGLHGEPTTPLWQRNYYEHVIRDEHALNQIRQYIADNPRLWAEDAENPLGKAVR
jgi:REP element-mobilizing transposase RayT